MHSMIVFPGQGSQVIGMGKVFHDTFHESKEVFEEVDEALKQNLSSLIFEGDIQELTQTENTQPALMAVSMAILRALEKQGNTKLTDLCSLLAGHSLGEYTAYCAANVFSLSDTAQLLRIRGEAMTNAVPKGQGGMAAILNLPFATVEEILQGICQTDNHVDIANDNSEAQIVISGHLPAVEEACRLAKEAGAKRAMMLPVSAPFHSILMQPAADIMQEAFAKYTVKDADIPVISNIAVQTVTQKQDITQGLVAQITGRVRWRETMTYIQNHSISRVIEIGSGKVLSNLLKRSTQDIDILNIETIKDLEAFLA